MGSDILSYCTRCKMELAHVVVSMIDTRAAKVLCKTCRSQHNHKRAPDERSARSSSSKRVSAPKTSIRASELWEQKLSEKGTLPQQPYQISKRFTQGDVIQHPQFGLGVVEEVRRNDKIVVLFREGEKVLVQGLVGQSARS